MVQTLFAYVQLIVLSDDFATMLSSYPSCLMSPEAAPLGPVPVVYSSASRNWGSIFWGAGATFRLPPADNGAATISETERKRKGTRLMKRPSFKSASNSSPITLAMGVSDALPYTLHPEVSI